MNKSLLLLSAVSGLALMSGTSIAAEPAKRLDACEYPKYEQYKLKLPDQDCDTDAGPKEHGPYSS